MSRSHLLRLAVAMMVLAIKSDFTVTAFWESLEPSVAAKMRRYMVFSWVGQNTRLSLLAAPGLILIKLCVSFLGYPWQYEQCRPCAFCRPPRSADG